MKKMPTYLVLFVIVMSAGATVTSAGSLKAWGYNYDGEISGVPTGDDFIAIAAGGYHGLALRTDHSIVGWGRNVDWPTPDWIGQAIPPSGNDFVAIAAGAWHSLAIKTDGSIVGWGRNSEGQIDVPAGNDFVAIGGGNTFSIALRSNGTIVAWGCDDSGQVSNAPTENGFKAIAAGQWHALALRTDGSIVCWGGDPDGQVSNAPTGNDFKAIAAGARHNYALKMDGSIVGWGWDAYGQVSDVPSGNGFVAIAAAHVHGVAIRADGSLACWGSDQFGLVTDVPSGNDFVAVSAGGAYTIVLQSVQSVTFYLHGIDPDLTLDEAAPTGTVAKYKDSPSVNRTAFKEIGTWTYDVLAAAALDSSRNLHVWVGLKNSDDQGTYFDIRGELLKNGTLVASGETMNVQGITRNPDKAKEVAVAFGTVSDPTLNPGDVLSLRILTKVTATGGHSSAVGLRLYYDSVSRPSRFEPGPTP